MDVILRANEKTYMEADKMWQETLFEMLEKNGTATRVREESMEKGREQSKEIIAKNLLRMGMPVDKIAQAAELPVEKIRSFENSE
jgi:predicted transposase/invertase (TIGR01784 family)